MKISRQGVAASNRFVRHHQETAMQFRCPLVVPILAAVVWFCLPASHAFADTVADPNAFKLGPGDYIQISVFGEEDLSMEFRLNDTGTLNYPFLGELTVEGLSVVRA